MNFEVRRWVLPYRPSRTCHSTATTMLFCILLLTTTPTFSDFCAIYPILWAGWAGWAGTGGKPASCLSCPSGLSCPLLPLHRLHAREIAADRAHLVRRLELSHRFLDSHPEQLVGEIALPGAEFVGAQVAQFGGLHSIFSSAKRVANLVMIGSFAAASRIASRASFSVTPSISNSTRPGRTTHTHW